MSVYRQLIFVYFIFCIIHAGWAQTTSGLPSGEVYQFSIPKDGVYRIDYDLLQLAGISVDQINPNHLHVYGQRGGMLSQSNASPLLSLTELSIYPVGLGDSTFDQGDFILLYAEGPDRLEYDTATTFYEVRQNIYTRENYIFITIEERLPKTVSKAPGLAYGWGVLIDTYIGVYHHEISEVNIVGSGRDWFGENFEEENPALTIPFRVPSITVNSQVKLQTALVSIASVPSDFTIGIGQQELGSVQLDPAQQTLYGYRGRRKTAFFSQTVSDEAAADFSVQIRPTGTAAGYLDYVTLNLEHPLSYEGTPLLFRNPVMASHYTTQYRVEQMTKDLKIWDVTDPLNVQEQQWTLTNERATFQVFADTVRSYIVFDPVKIEDRPTWFKKILHRGVSEEETPELLIITTEALQTEAKRLAQFRQQHDGLRSKVETLNHIYRMYSNGRQDVSAIRNYIKMLYDQDSALRYVLLFGDASYNYLTQENGNTNVVPTYQSYESLHSVHSYASDDYFGFLDQDEGLWEESSQSRPHDLEVAIGRIPVNTRDEAVVIVDKLIRYATDPVMFGKWKQQLLFVADDGDENKHQLRSDYLASLVEARTPFHTKRLFMDAFPQEEHSAPQFRNALDQQIQRGVFLVDFIGHGGETAWTDERILDLALIEEWKNQDRLPIFLTATCEFGRFDDPRRQSGAERALLHPKGGAIAMLTTTRPVFTNANFELSSAFYQVLSQSNLQKVRLGDLFRETKNRSISGTSNRNFALLGDPSMPLSFPEREATITHWETATLSSSDTLHPLQKVTLEGEIQLTPGKDSEFNGVVYLDFFAQPQPKEITGTDSGMVMKYADRSARLFQGKAQVKDGTFKFSLRIPKNIASEYGHSSISLYAVDERRKVDAIGKFEEIVLGGTPDESEVDRSPPQAQLFLNQITYPVTTTVHNQPTLLAQLSDPSGINTLPGKHSILLRVDEQEPQEIQDWYESDLDTDQRGSLAFPLPYLPPGKHTLTLQASDVYLNTTQQSLTFTVVSDSVFLLQDFAVFPNPTSDKINITFSVSEESKPIRTEIQLLSPIGKLVAQWSESVDSSSQSHTLSRSLQTDVPATFPPGIYLYRFYLFNEENEVVTRQGKIVFE